MVAVEPSKVMIEQRPPCAAPAVRAAAEALPLATQSCDAAMTVLVTTTGQILRLVRRDATCRSTSGGVGPLISLTETSLVNDYLPEWVELDASMLVIVDVEKLLRNVRSVEEVRSLPTALTVSQAPSGAGRRGS